MGTWHTAYLGAASHSPWCHHIRAPSTVCVEARPEPLGEVPRGTQEGQGLLPCTAHLEGPLGGQCFATSSESTGQTPALKRP